MKTPKEEMQGPDINSIWNERYPNLRHFSDVGKHQREMRLKMLQIAFAESETGERLEKENEVTGRLIQHRLRFEESQRMNRGGYGWGVLN
ncbi:hypothetical protein ACFLZH_05790 [Patescibacteria group bacterium]